MKMMYWVVPAALLGCLALVERALFEPGFLRHMPRSLFCGRIMIFFLRDQ